MTVTEDVIANACTSLVYNNSATYYDLACYLRLILQDDFSRPQTAQRPAVYPSTSQCKHIEECYESHRNGDKEGTDPTHVSR
jgi:hypothetical protein